MSTTQTEATGPTTSLGAPAVRLRASRATVTLLAELLAQTDLELDIIGRLIETDPAVTLHLLASANSDVRPGEELDTVVQALGVLDRSRLAALVERVTDDALDAVPQLWRILARALSCERLAQDRRGYTVGLLSGLIDLYGLPAAAVLETVGVSPLVERAVTEQSGRLGSALGALLGYLADDPALVARHGYDAATVYDAYVQGATTAMTTQSALAERATRTRQDPVATPVAQIPQPRTRAPRVDRADGPPSGAGTSPSEERR